MLRLDMNLVWNIVNFIVLYLLLRHFLIQPVLNIMNKRQELIASSIGSARESEDKAAALKDQYEEKLKGSEEESRQIVAQARQQAKDQYDRIVKEADDKAAVILKSARLEAEADREKAMNEVKAQLAGLVIAAAAKVVRDEAGEAENQALYEKYIAKAGDAHEAGGV